MIIRILVELDVDPARVAEHAGHNWTAAGYAVDKVRYALQHDIDMDMVQPKVISVELAS